MSNNTNTENSHRQQNNIRTSKYKQKLQILEALHIRNTVLLHPGQQTYIKLFFIVTKCTTIINQIKIICIELHVCCRMGCDSQVNESKNKDSKDIIRPTGIFINGKGKNWKR